MASLNFVGLLAIAAAPLPALGKDNAKEQARVRKITSDYAACVVRKHHTEASEVILATASNRAILNHFTQIIDSDCLGTAAGFGVDMRFPNVSYKFALADALVNADFAGKGDGSFANRLPLAQPDDVPPEKLAEVTAAIKSARKRKDAEQDIAKQNANAWLARYGECVVREDPVNARYLLLTPPDKPEETSRIVALRPALGACLGEGTMKFSRFTVRDTIAINYYRLAMATIVPSAGSSN